jgi:hypothetical protein
MRRIGVLHALDENDPVAKTLVLHTPFLVLIRKDEYSRRKDEYLRPISHAGRTGHHGRINFWMR